MNAYPAEGQLVAVAGEELACPECGETVAVFLHDHYGYPPFPLEMHGWYDEGRSARCACGGSTSKVKGSNWIPGYVRAQDASMILIHVRSGAWTGWRSIGAE